MLEEVKSLIDWIDTLEKHHADLNNMLEIKDTEIQILTEERDCLIDKLKSSQTQESIISLQQKLSKEKLDEYFLYDNEKNTIITSLRDQRRRLMKIVVSHLSGQKVADNLLENI